ncbi:MAG: hypothetical protein Q7V15_02915 [Phenylobacterium sp.]|uniref:hypothetical protein n=1 Tax=Phenylobacterium sp. TaxID=1871053 RepID=UPI00272062D1|nr:hypothetical protein [Phenylobacterium sp.]MDO8900284.1 hypothetical protein [Phenylobacterium sp.]MDP2215623.1 hypothetical protein [Phenylobacterium sp.]
MTYDPNTPRTDAPPPQREVVQKSGNATGWWVAGIVAIVALVGMFFVFGNNGADDMDLEAARDTGRAEAMIDNAAQSAQNAASEAAESSRAAADSVAASAEAAADRTAAATQDAADSASDAVDRTGM